MAVRPEGDPAAPVICENGRCRLAGSRPGGRWPGNSSSLKYRNGAIAGASASISPQRQASRGCLSQPDELTVGLTPEMIDRSAAAGRRGGPAEDPSDQEDALGGAIEASTGAEAVAILLPQPRGTARLEHDWARPMSTGRGKRIKSRRRRRNPVARTLRDPAFRARREANRRRYSRKLKHKEERQRDDG
jgi:hypothetical protein